MIEIDEIVFFMLCMLCGVCFGFWQHSFNAAFFMALFIYLSARPK